MSGDASLIEYIEALKGQGAADEFVVALLRQNGWSEKRIYQAFGAWYEARTGKAAPNGGGRIEAAKDAFFYLLTFITLGIWTIQLGSLMFTIIDLYLPNPSVAGVYSGPVPTQLVAGALASIIVAFPIFLLVTRSIVRGARGHPERLESGVRKWLTWIALVVTASTMIGDVVTFLTYFLEGDLSTRFVLQVLTVLLLAGGVFAYYRDSLRAENMSNMRNRWFALAASAAVLFGLMAGFAQIGSPIRQRVASHDRRRLYDLSMLASGLHTRWMQTDASGTFKLPANIQELRGLTVVTDVSIVDPQSSYTYTYEPAGNTLYRLCANFSGASSANDTFQWRHPAGYHCFTMNASREVEVIPLNR